MHAYIELPKTNTTRPITDKDYIQRYQRERSQIEQIQLQRGFLISSKNTIISKMLCIKVKLISIT